jgi:hypothetical protein
MQEKIKIFLCIESVKPQLNSTTNCSWELELNVYTPLIKTNKVHTPMMVNNNKNEVPPFYWKSLSFCTSQTNISKKVEE